MDYFRYGADEVEHLKQRDAALGAAIDQIGPIQRTVIPDLFTALVHSIVSQQISNKAAATVWARLQERHHPLSARGLAGTPVDDIQRCGLSFRKAGYIHSLAAVVDQGELDLAELPQLPDGDVIQRLSTLPGIGVWTAEMLLIFSMQRPDVVSWGDLAIRRGMSTLYQLDALDRATFERLCQGYSPYGSVASLYLWEIARSG